MPGEPLQRTISFIDRQDRQSVSVDGGMKDGFQVVVVGLLVGVQWLSIVRRGEGMNRSRIKARFAKGGLDRLVIDAGHFDCDDGVLDAFGLAGSGSLLGHRSEYARVMPNDRGLDDDPAEVIAEHPFGSLRDGPGVVGLV